MTPAQLTTRSGPTIKRGRSKQDYETPAALIAACQAKFGPITFDLAASLDNAKAPGFFSKEDDALYQSWPNDRLCWLNPPFDNICKWAIKCSQQATRGCRILFLTPASVGSNWFRDYVHKKAIVYALNGRITFVGCADPYPKDCIVSAYGLGSVGFDVWTWVT